MAEPSASGEVVVTTTRKRVIEAKERATPDFWEYLEKLNPQDWDRHIVYMYRRDSDTSTGPSVFLEKLTGNISLPDSTVVPMTSREDVEYAIAKKYGGRIFRLILKNGGERVSETRVYIDMPPKVVQAQADPMPGVQVHPSDSTAAIASEAMRTVAGQEGNGLIIAANVLNSAANVVKNLSERGNTPPAPSETDQMLKMMMLKMMEKMMDRFDAPPPTGSSNSAIVERLLSAAVDRMLNPMPQTTGPAVSATAELVRSLPSIGNTIVTGLQEWRLGMEAQKETVQTMAKNPGVLPGPGPALPAQVPSDAAAPPGAQPQRKEVPLEFIEGKIIQILQEPISADQAADKTLEFLETIDDPNHPQLVPQLVSTGENGLLLLFQNRPTLRPAMANLGRVKDFIAAFIKYATMPPDVSAPQVGPN